MKSMREFANHLVDLEMKTSRTEFHNAILAMSFTANELHAMIRGIAMRLNGGVASPPLSDADCKQMAAISDVFSTLDEADAATKLGEIILLLGAAIDGVSKAGEPHGTVH